MAQTNKIIFLPQKAAEDPGKFEQKTNIVFQNKGILKQAFAHRSYLNENRGLVAGSNERLEFLGDAVVELIVTNYLYRKYPDCPEGDLTNYRSALVNARMFAEVAQELGMHNYILLSEGQKKDNHKSLQSILADAFEAFVGAVYLDQGYGVAEAFIASNLLPRIDEIVRCKLWRDPKSFLQEKAQEHFKFTPMYDVVSETGSDHDKTFIVEVYFGDIQPAKGTGKSKSEAEQQAARNALEVKNWF